MSTRPPADLATVIAALRDAPEFLAGWLGRIPDGEDLLRERLSLSDTQLHRLLTCRTPHPLHFGRDVQALARFIDVPDTALAAALREASVLAALATGKGSTGDGHTQVAREVGSSSVRRLSPPGD